MSEELISKIKELSEKKDKAKAALARATVQLESLQEQKESLEQKFKDEFGTTVDKADQLITKYTKTLNKAIEVAEDKLKDIKL